MKSRLFDQYSDGDRRTVVRSFKAGDTILISKPNLKTIVFRFDCRLPVTQEWSVHQGKWIDIVADLEHAVGRAPVEPQPNYDRVSVAGVVLLVAIVVALIVLLAVMFDA